MNPETRMSAHERRRSDNKRARPVNVRGIVRGLVMLWPFEPDPLPQIWYANPMTGVFVGCPLRLTTPLGEYIERSQQWRLMQMLSMRTSTPQLASAAQRVNRSRCPIGL
jgi:hypothetical protein